MTRERLILALGGALAVLILAAIALGASTSSRPLEAFVFYVFGGTIAGAALAIVLTRDIVRAAAWLLATLCAAAGLYLLLAANFLAAVQLIVYAGGILVLIVFGIMLTARGPAARFAPTVRERIVTGGVVLLLFAGMVGLLLRGNWPPIASPVPPTATATEVKAIGRGLLTDYLLPFEVISILLLAAMIGAAYLARPVRK